MNPAIPAQQASRRSLASPLESLDRDLSALERELEELQPLLGKKNAPPQAARLAKRLSVEIVRLKQRREVLKSLWSESRQ